MIYACCSTNRRNAILNQAAAALAAKPVQPIKVPNGVDYLEVLDGAAPPSVPRQQTLFLHCLYGLSQMNPPVHWTTDNLAIEGGVSVTGIQIRWVIPASSVATSTQADIAALAPVIQAPGFTDLDKVLVIRTDRAGDFSTYRLRLVNSALQAAGSPFEVSQTLAGFDPQLAAVDFSFKVECGLNFDCATSSPDCAQPSPIPPPINYLAKDYGSFRSIILDRLNQLVPSWGATSEADFGVVLAELIAYVGDQLSYQQDAVATEAYLETARSRISLRRHARLVDYRAHDGCNARTWIQLQAAGNVGDGVFLDRTLTRFYTNTPGLPSTLAIGSDNETAALSAGATVFQPMQDATLFPEHNQIQFYTWGDTACCLPMGATEATLTGSLNHLQPGDVLIFQEVLGPQTGNGADADIRHRCAVRLTQVATTNASGAQLVDTLFQPPVSVTEIQWSAGDALTFPLCLSASFLDGDEQVLVTDVTVAFGNVILADHGLSVPAKGLPIVPAPRLFQPPNLSADRCAPANPSPFPVRYAPSLPEGPVTQAVPSSLTGLPVTSGVVSLGGNAPLNLVDTNGLTSLSVQITQPGGWPDHFAVSAKANATNPSNFDLSLLYQPANVVVEQFTNLSFNKTDPNYVATRINNLSNLLLVPGSYNPPASPAAVKFSLSSTPLTNTGAVNVQDAETPGVTFLVLEAADSADWPLSFGVQAAALPPPGFELFVVYNPPSGPAGVPIPVTVETFKDLSLDAFNTESVINKNSAFITVQCFSGAPDLALSATDLMTVNPADGLPCITLTGTYDEQVTTWTPEPDLLENGDSDPVFVVEVDTDGSATLRFGDNINGRTPDSGTTFAAAYRIGNGAAGNVGADSFRTLAVADARIRSCRNPLPATGGTEPETNDQIRRRAPVAFLTQERAVTMADYAAMAELNPQVDRAVASLRWTGSWYTVSVAVEPAGGGNLTGTLSQTLESSLERYRLAGQDLELASPQYVSLEIALQICVDPNYFRSDVESSLSQVLGSGFLPNGTKGLFYPDNFTFGQTVYLSSIYAGARSVPGVQCVVATTFQQQGVDTAQFLATGEIPIGPLQVARLANDPNFPDHGQLTFEMEGGK